jgi:hypothetical protein
VAVDLDLSLACPAVPGLEFRQADILAGPVEPGGFDLVFLGSMAPDQVLAVLRCRGT